jgi:hypothetical protein
MHTLDLAGSQSYARGKKATFTPTYRVKVPFMR